MCLREGPPPVFIDVGGARSPFLDDLFGETLADAVRSLVGAPPFMPMPILASSSAALTWIRVI
jgi:hypothetical protein